MTEEFVPVDQEQRDRIASALDETLFVEAGAGTGKTKVLVSRIATLIKSGKATVDGIAAITFTEAAAAELRDRVRQELEEWVHKTESSESERERCLKAVGGLENSSIRTLHSFAGALLRERPLEAGLPPNFDTVEEIEADITFEERWQQWLEVALESETVTIHLQRAFNLGLKLDQLRAVAKAFHDSYDLLPGCFPPEAEPPRQAARKVIEAAADIRKLLPLAYDGLDDPLASHSSLVAELGDRLTALGAESDATLAMLARRSKLSCGSGNQRNWDTNPATGLNGCTELKGILKELEDARIQELDLVRRASLMPLLESLRRFALDYVEERRRSGKAEFHDLLVWARDLLRHNPEVRDHFQKRFTHILIDEFQDTDPIQAEIAFFLAGDSGTNNSEDKPIDWTSLKILPGKLFVVGDPKQSIYRFRRADIAAVEQVRGLMGSDTVALSQNFRSQETIINWVNSIFFKWMGKGTRGIQAPYLELAPRWIPPHAEPPLGVHYFGGPRDGYAAWVRRQEAEAVTAVLHDIKSRPWKVRDGDATALRKSRYQDVCILMPTRTGLQTLERALEGANIPYRIESESLVLGTQDVQEILSCLRSIDSPVDQVALVAALRSSAFACSDVELLQFVENGGNLDYIKPGTATGPVRDALAVLYRYHHERMWAPVDELIERFIRERQMTEVCFGRQRPRERLRRLRLVVERARAFAQVEEASLRAFLDWIERQAEEGARMVEVPVPETDEDAVRIMTIHAAKGLEFPIVILTGLGSSARHSTGPVVFDRANHSVEVRVGPAGGSSFSTADYEDAQEREKEAGEAEGIRLMYVCATRARDHLIVSLFHSEKSKSSHAAIISHHGSEKPELWHELTLQPAEDVSEPVTDTEDKKSDTQADRDTWLEGRRQALQSASRPASVAVTAIAKVDKEEAEKGEVYYRRGRGGTNLGRAVHSVLQSVDLATGAGLEQVSKAQAEAEGIAGKWQEVAELARKGLESSIVRRAVAFGKYYREVFVSAPLEDGLIEGFIDLLFEEDGGLVVVDYKTDVLEEEGVPPKVEERYTLQAGAYALIVTEVTGKSVREAVIVFLRTGQELTIGDIDDLQSKARDRAMAMLPANRT